MTEPTYSTRQIDGLWHMIKTEGGRETAYPAGTELVANMMVSLETTDRDRAKAGLPPIKRA